jgi:hypothetical protein
MVEQKKFRSWRRKTTGKSVEFSGLAMEFLWNLPQVATDFEWTAAMELSFGKAYS